MNGRDQRLQLDTGASGIVIGRKVAEKAGLTRISEERYTGIGDKGVQSGYSALATQIRVGDLEFEDCIVHVATGLRSIARTGWSEPMSSPPI